MKKFILPILLFLMFIPFYVNAKEYCTIVSGNDKDIGSEIACGTEHFYIIDSDGENLKMLAKYNLYVGLEINQVGPTFDNVWDAKAYCSTLTDYDSVAVWPSLSEPGKYYCHTEKELEYDKIRQNPEAVGLTIKDGRYVIKQVGIIYMSDQFSYDNISDANYDQEHLDDEGNINLRYSEVQGYLDEYKDELNNNGYSLEKIELIKLNRFNELIKKVSGRELELGLEDSYFINLDTNTLWEQIGGDYQLEAVHININDYIPDNYSWIDSTTYWLGSSLVDNRMNNIYDIFMTTLGDLCAVNRWCSGFIKFGAGIRPVVTMSKTNIKYNIRTKTDGNGTIDVADTASGGDSIRFKVSTKRGLKLAGLTITTDSGEKVEFNEEDITTDSTGILSISTNKFTMPYENVTIEAKWKSTINVPNTLINPNTGTGISIIIIFLLVISSIIYTVFKRKKNYIIK